MKISKYLHSLLLVMVLLVLLSSAVLSGTISGFIVGVPASCRSSVSLIAPESIQLHPGDLKEVPIVLTNISCGISYVRFVLVDFPSDYYDYSPSYIPNIGPRQTKNTTIYFDIPTDAETVTYESTYRFYTNEGTFNLGNVEIEVIEPEKPASKIISAAQVTQIETRGSQAAVDENQKFWFVLALFSSVVAILIIGYEYFTVSEKSLRKEAYKRPAGSIYKALGLGPERAHKEEFEKVLKKKKKSGK